MALFIFVIFFLMYFPIKYDPLRSGNTTIGYCITLLILLVLTYFTDITKWVQIDERTAKTIFFGALALLSLIMGVRAGWTGYQLKKRQREHCDTQQLKLFSKRQDDLQRLKENIDTFNIVGIDASWGMGKTFLLDYFKREREICNQYYVVEINVLTCKLDQLIPVLFHDLDQVLKEDGILSLQSESVKMLCDSQKGIRSIINLIFGSTEGSAQALLAFKKQLESMHKRIVIIYEDLDRVDDVKIIKQILSISLLLSSSCIKILYQYDSEKMRHSLDIGMDYLEKYIPYHMKLTALDFEEIVIMTLKELKIDKHLLSLSDLNFPSMRDINAVIQEEDFMWHESPMRLMLSTAKYTPRNIKLWIDDIKMYLSSDSFYKKSDNKKLLIRMLYLKHLHPEYYAKISFSNHNLNLMRLEKEDGMEYNDLSEVTQLMYDEDKKKDFILDERNKERIGVLDFLCYQLYLSEYKETDPEIKKHRIKIKFEEHNLRLNRIYNHIVMAGGHHQTNRETILSKIKHDVLSKEDIDEQYKAWEDIVGKSYLLNQHIDGYITINNIGHSYFEDILDSAFLVSFTDQEECRLLRLYNAKRIDNESLNLEYIQVVRYARMSRDAIFSLIVSQIAHFNVIGNFLFGESESSFRDFMYIFSLACRKLGYIDNRDYEDIQREPDVKCRYLEFLKAVKIHIELLASSIELSDQGNVKELFSNIKSTSDVLIDSIQDEKSIQYNPIQVKFSSISERREALDSFLSEKKDLPNDSVAQKHFKDEVLHAREIGQIDWNDVRRILSDKTE